MSNGPAARRFVVRNGVLRTIRRFLEAAARFVLLGQEAFGSEDVGVVC